MTVEQREQIWQRLCAIPGGAGYWGRLQDFAVSLVEGTARRCAEIAKQHDALGSGADAIRREFGIEPTERNTR